MVLIMFVFALIPSLGFTSTASGIRIQYIHVHDHAGHGHNHETEETASGNSDSHTEKHNHELVISSATSTYIETKNNLVFTLSLSIRTFPETQDDKLLLSNYLSSIFRPPIAA